MSSPWTTALLERTADEVVVLAPPVEPMLAEAGRLRRRRRAAVGGAVLAVLVTLGAADAVTSFVAPDREGLFASLAGTFTAGRVDVLSVDLFTREDGLVIDTFQPRGRDVSLRVVEPFT